jgi:Helix-turn-helix domain
MSIRIMTQVWDKSMHKGSELLLMLAIADNANDEGIAWPRIATIARKIRMSTRQTKRLIKSVESSGELEVVRARGRKYSSTYRIVLPDEKKVTTCHPSDKKGDRSGQEKVTELWHPEPNTMNHISLSLSDNDLKRLGLTPGSIAWKAVKED